MRVPRVPPPPCLVGPRGAFHCGWPPSFSMWEGGGADLFSWLTAVVTNVGGRGCARRSAAPRHVSLRERSETLAMEKRPCRCILGFTDGPTRAVGRDRQPRRLPVPPAPQQPTFQPPCAPASHAHPPVVWRRRRSSGGGRGAAAPRPSGRPRQGADAARGHSPRRGRYPRPGRKMTRLPTAGTSPPPPPRSLSAHPLPRQRAVRTATGQRATRRRRALYHDGGGGGGGGRHPAGAAPRRAPPASGRAPPAGSTPTSALPPPPPGRAPAPPMRRHHRRGE